MATRFQKTWLIQRLEAPLPNDDTLSRLAFGGGGGHISEDGWKAIRQIWRFDYMGAAEFEHGAVPDAIQKMVDDKMLVRWKIGANGGYLHIIGSADERDEIERRIDQDLAGQLSLKEDTLLRRAVGIEKVDFPIRTVGWLELDNGFFFTIDETMADRYWELLQHVRGHGS